MIPGSEGSLGSKVTAKTGLLEVDFFLVTLSRAFHLGIDFAFSIAASIIFGLYFLEIKSSFSSESLWSRCSGSEQILMIL